MEVIYENITCVCFTTYTLKSLFPLTTELNLKVNRWEWSLQAHLDTIKKKKSLTPASSSDQLLRSASGTALSEAQPVGGLDQDTLEDSEAASGESSISLWQFTYDLHVSFPCLESFTIDLHMYTPLDSLWQFNYYMPKRFCVSAFYVYTYMLDYDHFMAISF